MRIAPSTIAGLGCFADKDIKKGEIVGEYTGELITAEEGDRRYEGVEHIIWLFQVEDNMCIDAMHADCDMKYVNHCCDPNCESEVDGHRVFYLALRDIKEGEELTVDYELVLDPDEEDPCTCACGSPKCRGNMKDPTADKS